MITFHAPMTHGPQTRPADVPTAKEEEEKERAAQQEAERRARARAAGATNRRTTILAGNAPLQPQARRTLLGSSGGL